MDEQRAGVVGMGKMGLLHAGILNSLDGIKVVSVADTEKLVTNFIKKNMSEIKIFDDYKKMIVDSDLDFIYITTPVASHVPIASFATEHSLSFFVEKPLGRNITESLQLCNIVQNHKIPTMVGFYLRYADTFVKARELLNTGIIGNIRSINSSVYQTQFLTKSTGWRFKKEVSGGGVLIDLGSHLIDLLLWFFGPVKSVDASIKSEFSQEVEDSASGGIEFENGMKATFDVSWTLQNYRLQETTIEIEGEKGKITVNEDYVRISNSSTTGQSDMAEKTIYRQAISAGVPIDIGGPEYTKEDVHFVDCIRNRKEPVPNIIDASNTQSVIDSMYRSSKSRNKENVLKVE